MSAARRQQGLQVRADNRHASRPTRDLLMYEQLIEDGIVAADKRGVTVDHVTARRIALWLLAQPQQEPDFMRQLITFGKTGAITQQLRRHLRTRALKQSEPHALQAARLLQYTTARSGNLGPISPDFAAICDQFDRADAMLADLRQRARSGQEPRQPTWPETDGPDVVALAHHEAHSKTVILVLDDTTANIAMYAVVAHALEREAHAREVQRHAQTLPENSHGRTTDRSIAAREIRIAARLRATERAYHAALDREPTPEQQRLEAAATDRPLARELELE